MPKKNLQGQRFGRLVAIKATDKRKRGVVVWQCQCDCGNLTEATTTDLTCNRKKSCGCLEKQHQQTFGQQMKKQKMIDRSGVRYGRLVALYPTDKRSGSNIVWHCKCDCGNECDVSGANLGTTVFSCGCLRKEMAQEKGKNLIKDLTGRTFGQLTVLSYQEIKDKLGSHWLCECSCGNKIIASAQGLVQGKTTSCGCKYIKSKGEQKIISLLKQHNIPFIQEKSFENCRFKDTNALARFDFYVNNQYLIEYDGEQHFDKTNKWNQNGIFQKVQQHDKYKNLWCKEYNIPLIRIPYTYLNQLKIEDLLLETSNFTI